jgi:hypothetical protein
MPILDIQKRARELGRIRIGHQGTATGHPPREARPVPPHLRLRPSSRRSPSSTAARSASGPPGGGTQQWEVVTDSTRLPIMVPPQPVTQWYEYWTGGGCQHRCDGRTNVLTDEPATPRTRPQGGPREAHHPPQRRPPRRRGHRGLAPGDPRLERRGRAPRRRGVPRPGRRLRQRLALARAAHVEGEVRPTRAAEDRHFMVPIIEIDVTPAQLMAGHGRVAAPAFAGGPVGARPRRWRPRARTTSLWRPTRPGRATPPAPAHDPGGWASEHLQKRGRGVAADPDRGRSPGHVSSGCPGGLCAADGWPDRERCDVG